MKLTDHEKNLVIELIASFSLALALCSQNAITMAAGFVGFLAVIDLLNTNIRRMRDI